MKIKNLKVLNKKQVKHLLQKIYDQWGAEIDLKEYGVLVNHKSKFFITNKEIFDIDLSKLRINSLGLYIGELEHGIRLSIEGSQLIGPYAKKNIIEVDSRQRQDWLKGEDINIKGHYKGFVIIKHCQDYLGSGKFKDDKILNFVPKTRRLNS